MLAGQAAAPTRRDSLSQSGIAVICLFAAAGAVAFLLVQLYLFATAPDGFNDSADGGWFLNSRRGIIDVAYALGCAAVAMSFVANKRIWLQGYFVAGAMTAMTLVLFALGAGNLFPIVLGFGTAIVLLAVISGSLAGFVANLAIRGVWQLTHRTAR